MTRLTAIAASVLLAVGTAACGGGETGTKQGQDQATGQKAGTAEPAIQVSDAELESFVRASMELEAFQKQMRKRMSAASGTEARRKVRKRLMQERDSIVVAAGLSSAGRYDTIMESLKSAGPLQDRYTALRDSMEAGATTADTMEADTAM